MPYWSINGKVGKLDAVRLVVVADRLVGVDENVRVGLNLVQLVCLVAYNTPIAGAVHLDRLRSRTRSPGVIVPLEAVGRKSGKLAG